MRNLPYMTAEPSPP
ncbi:hypothetical protein E2C01_089597 [Portunus trituberculatus]|uniref:Uncharacterized protein n=1 Tax=Portunus trituberculatus TaxID=210409 RepID=A0A5B7JHN8_PORTR|nr:hypothetical protein [Portunus trituberculatus]